MVRVKKISRRTFLAGTALAAVVGAGGLWLGAFSRPRWATPVRRPQSFAPSVFLAIDGGGAITIWLTRSEMGQGVHTALPMIVAEELEADWSKVRVEQAIADGKHDYGRLRTAASSSVRSLWTELRTAGAAAREMLIAAAAVRWSCDDSDCRAEASSVVHRSSGRRLGYGELADAAARLRVPARPRLKSPKEFRLVGARLPRLDAADKSTGRATYGLDVRLQELGRATVARCPYIGGRLARYDDRRARQVTGVRTVLPITSGVAVVADNTWAALEGRRALDITWDPGPNATLSTKAIDAHLHERLQQSGVAAATAGDALTVIAGAPARIEATYSLPYLAHAPMEPINCTARVADGWCEVWAPTQDPELARETAARVALLPVGRVIVHTMLAGGGFGRRTMPDEIADAVEIARQVSGPVQVIWSREDDIQHDHYREISLHHLSAVLDDQRVPQAWFHRVVTPSLSGLRSDAGQLDDIAVLGAAPLPYALPHVRTEWRSADLPVPVGIWRSVGFSYNTFAVESFVDELALAAGRDPVELRLELLAKEPRLRACVDQVAQRAGWGRAKQKGRGLGVAAASCFGSHVAQIADVSVGGDEGGAAIRVHKVWCAVDCGTVVNPGIVEAQVEGGVAFGLTAALHGRIRIEGGRVVESNFHDYPLLRIDEMPDVEVILLSSAGPPGGVGELAVPTVAPAVGNAIFAASGTRRRALPFLG